MESKLVSAPASQSTRKPDEANWDAGFLANWRTHQLGFPVSLQPGFGTLR
jgi:hypothetical protein